MPDGYPQSLWTDTPNVDNCRPFDHMARNALAGQRNSSIVVSTRSIGRGRNQERNAMSAVVPINIDGRPGLLVQAKQGMEDLVERARRESCMIDARLRTLTAEPEEGAATAEYAVVLIAATGFAALLVAILKSDAIKTLLTNIVKKALNVG